MDRKKEEEIKKLKQDFYKKMEDKTMIYSAILWGIKIFFENLIVSLFVLFFVIVLASRLYFIRHKTNKYDWWYVDGDRKTGEFIRKCINSR